MRPVTTIRTERAEEKMTGNEQVKYLCDRIDREMAEYFIGAKYIF